MNNLDEEQGLIRSYLLGEATTEEQELLEQRVLLDGEFREMVSLVEEEMVEDFLRGHLPERHRQKFSEQYLTTPQQATKVRMLEALHRYGAKAQEEGRSQTTEAAKASEPRALEEIDAAPHALSLWYRFLSPRAWSMAYRLVAAGFVIVALALGFVLFKSLRESEGRTRIEQEVARLNDPQSQGPPSDPRITLTVSLSPILVRDVARAEKINLTPETAVVSLRLRTAGGNYRSFQATLRVTGGAELFVIRNLRLNGAGSEQQVVLYVPADILKRGDYQLELAGVAADGRTSALGDYFFRVNTP